LNIIDIQIVGVFYVVVNNTYVRWRHDFVGNNNESSIVGPNEIDKDLWFYAFQSTIKIDEIDDMFAWQEQEFLWVVATYGDNNLLAQ